MNPFTIWLPSWEIPSWSEATFGRFRRCFIGYCSGDKECWYQERHREEEILRHFDASRSIRSYYVERKGS